jgi:DNA mismatch repair protein MutS
LLSLHKEKEKYGIALVDVSTGEFLVAEGNLEKLLHIVHTFDPSKLFIKELPKFLLNLKIKTVLS